MNKAGDAVAEIGKDVTMQIAAMNPIAIDKDGVPEDVKQREMEIGREQARAEVSRSRSSTRSLPENWKHITGQYPAQPEVRERQQQVYPRCTGWR